MASAAAALQVELDRAEQLIASVDFAQATDVLHGILKENPKCCAALDMLAELHLNLGESEKAGKLFLRSVQLAPTENSSKYMYLGQLHEGKPALKFFRKGVEVTRAQLEMAVQAAKNANIHDDVASLRRNVADLKLQLSNQLCSCAELFVTDLCFEPDAEKNTEGLLRQALESYPYNPEALYASANLRSIQERFDEGETMLLRCVSVLNSIASVYDADIWRDLRELQLDDETDDEEEDERGEQKKSKQQQQQKQQPKASSAQTVEAVEKAAGLQNLDHIVRQAPELESSVSYELRLNAAKLLIEYGKFELACAQLEYCLRSNDRFVSVWYLLGCCWFERRELQTAYLYLSRAQRMIQKLDESDEGEPDEELESLRLPLETIVSKVEAAAKQSGMELQPLPDEPNLASLMGGGGEDDDDDNMAMNSDYDSD